MGLSWHKFRLLIIQVETLNFTLGVLFDGFHLSAVVRNWFESKVSWLVLIHTLPLLHLLSISFDNLQFRIHLFPLTLRQIVSPVYSNSSLALDMTIYLHLLELRDVITRKRRSLSLILHINTVPG